MARPKKVRDAEQRSMRLPGELIRRLEKAAEKMGLETSDVIREILHAFVEDYIRVAEDTQTERLFQKIHRVSANPVLEPYFKKYQESNVLPVVIKGLSEDQQNVLAGALRAYRELRTSSAASRWDSTGRTKAWEILERREAPFCLMRLLKDGQIVVRELGQTCLIETGRNVVPEGSSPSQPHDPWSDFANLVKSGAIGKRWTYRDIDVYELIGSKVEDR